MIASFFHDSTLVKKNNKYYTMTVLNNTAFEHYSRNVDKLIVVTRYVDYEEKYNKYICAKNEINLPNITFSCVKSYKEAPESIKNVVNESDFIILRIHSIISSIAYFYVKKYSKKYMCECVSCAFDCLWYYNLKGKFFAIPMYFFTKLIAKNAYAVTYVSTLFLQKRYPTRGLKLSCSDVYISRDLKTKLNEREMLYKDINSRDVSLCNIANLDVKYKGQKYILEAVKLLKLNGINTKLYLIGAGSGNYLKKIAKKLEIEDNVIYVGALQHDQIFDFLKKIDIYVQPSNAESHGRVILEAMSVGCPVIGSNVGGIPELVHDENVFKKAKYKDLYKKILSLINSKEKMLSSSYYSLKKVSEFEYEKLFLKKENFIEEVFIKLNECQKNNF